MERLPAELILHIASFLEARDLVPVHLASKHLFKITRDSELWKRFCLDDSHSEAARRRQDFLYGPPIPIQEPRVFELRRAVARSDNNNASPTAETATARAMATWDPTYPDEKVDWYGEYIARHASLSMSWLEQPFNEQNGLRKKSETRGLGIFRNHDDNLVVAPLDDGSVCLWNIGREDAAPNPQDGRIMARSRPGLLSVNGPDGSIPQNPTKSRAKMTSTGVVECVSVDRARNKAYFAVQSGLNEVDLTTLQISSYDRYPFSITALSEATHPVPLTVGTSLSLHLHDPRLGNNGGSPTSWISDRVDTNANASQNPPYSTTDFHRLSSGDSSQTDYATLFHPSPLSILHLNPSSTIYVAGRFPSILNYDRRCFPKLTSTIHSGARLCSISSLPTPNHPTLAAVGEYNGKGSLELYPLDSAFTASPSDSISDQPTRNRTSASRSKLLSLTPHGTRLLFSDSDGQLKWVERDGSSLVRRWNINTFDTSISDSESARSGIFNVDPNEGDVARKLLPVGTGARSEVCVWTGEKIGVLGFKDKPRFSFGVDKDGTCTPEGSSDGESIDERDYERMMRRALERQADEVRFVRGLGLGG
ncbi:MAG: hypothetical protein ALECFALPRED_007033 [Alectoria fallacina]|uniref:F-box domain-containing protein n=1 Tax=Alectoria fallacina TaxID=1903189 RepID=A0A8H3G584_9LECA|nr:MAG: hypothetical protein ALECFALPRED_007033 [Alectoria fallacina]